MAGKLRRASPGGHEKGTAVPRTKQDSHDKAQKVPFCVEARAGASGPGQDIPAGVYLPALHKDIIALSAVALRLHIPQNSPYAGQIRNCGPGRLREACPV